jgi:hypothetical protein
MLDEIVVFHNGVRGEPLRVSRNPIRTTTAHGAIIHEP